MNTYPVDARVRVGQEHGTITAIGASVNGDPLARPFYHVAFDGDTSPDETDKKGKRRIQNTRIVLHEDILQCWYDGGPFNPVQVEAALLEKFVGEDSPEWLGPIVTAEMGGGKKNARRADAIAIPNPVEWDGRFWINTGSCYDVGARCWLYAELYPLVPLAEYEGEIREPHFTRHSYGGYRVCCDLGEFVIDDHPVSVCGDVPIRTTPVRMSHEDKDEPRQPQARRRRSDSRPEPSKSAAVPRQASYFDQ
jgi:hypothetical protein